MATPGPSRRSGDDGGWCWTLGQTSATTPSRPLCTAVGGRCPNQEVEGPYLTMFVADSCSAEFSSQGVGR